MVTSIPILWLRSPTKIFVWFLYVHVTISEKYAYKMSLMPAKKIYDSSTTPPELFRMYECTYLDRLILWRHQMETFSALLALCTGNSPVPGEFPTRRPVTRSFDVFFDLRLNKWLSKQAWGWWSETLSCPLWRHCNEKQMFICIATTCHIS